MILFSYSKKEYYMIEVKGHALYDSFGKDIVCASVSTLLLCSYNLILKLKRDYKIINFECNDGLFCLTIDTKDEVVISILENIYESLEQISYQYPKNIKNFGR